MKKSQWLELVESKKDAIMEAFMDANKESALDYLYPSRHGGGIAVTLDSEGNLHSFYQQRNELTGEAQDGTEIYLGYFSTASNWNFENEEEDIEAFLNDKFQEFEDWCDKNDVSISLSSMQEWNEDLYEELVTEIITNTVDVTSYDIAEEKLESIKDELLTEVINEA